MQSSRDKGLGLTIVSKGAAAANKNIPQSDDQLPG